MKILHVAVGIPGAQWEGSMGLALANMIAMFAQVPVFPGTRHKLDLIGVKGSILPKSRWDIVQKATARGAEWLLMVDSDQTFPRDTLHRLIRHDKDVVAANVAIKKLPSAPTARAFGPDGGIPVYTDPASKGLEQIWRIGCGVILMRVSVFSKLIPGFFEIRWKEEIQDYQGEDWTMMEALEQAGIPVFIDHDLSKQVEHLGTLEFTHDLVGELKGGPLWLRQA